MVRQRSLKSPQLTPDFVLSAYMQGYFPMSNGPIGPVGFYAYEPRGIIPLDERFAVRRSLRQIVNRGDFEIRVDQAFEQVIRECSRHDVLPHGEIWLSESMIDVYIELHKQGHAHSVETWSKAREGDEAKLLGGLYGVAIGGLFCGESMFSTAPYASQIALVKLVERLRERGFSLLDAQMPTEHLRQFGLYDINHRDYLDLLRQAVSLPVSFL